MMKDRIAEFFFFTLFIFLLYLAGSMLAPFFSPLLAAFSAAVVCYPMHRWIGRQLKKSRPTLQASLSLLAVFFFIVTPLAFIISATVAEASNVLPGVRTRVQTGAVSVRDFARRHADLKDRLPPRVAAYLESSTGDIETRIQTVIERALGFIAASATGIAKDVVSFFGQLVLFLFVLFFLFRDGPFMYRAVLDYLPLTAAMKERLSEKTHETVEAVVRGTMLVGLIQGLFAMIGYLIAGTHAAVLLGCLTAIASLIPAIGTAVIWVPVCIFLFLTGSYGQGTFLLVWGGLLGVVDNIARPIVVGHTSQMSFFGLSMALLGGLTFFGFKGLLLGPLIFSLLPIFFDFFRNHLMKTGKTPRP